jgi:putative chitinase
MMDVSQLQACTGASATKAAFWLDPITAAMDEFGIDTLLRQAAFLAQVGHESAGLYYTVELWGPTAAQLRYEGRTDLGNIQLGDGSLFRGRGLIQITGRSNYKAVGDALGVDFVASPAALEESPAAARSAAWFWSSRNLNALADTGDFPGITRKINGGLNGYSNRFDLWQRAQKALGVAS